MASTPQPPSSSSSPSSGSSGSSYGGRSSSPRPRKPCDCSCGGASIGSGLNSPPSLADNGRSTSREEMERQKTVIEERDRVREIQQAGGLGIIPGIGPALPLPVRPSESSPLGSKTVRVPILGNRPMDRTDAVHRLARWFRQVTDELNRVRDEIDRRKRPGGLGDRVGRGGRSLRALEVERARLDRLQSQIMGAAEEIGIYL